MSKFKNITEYQAALDANDAKWEEARAIRPITIDRSLKMDAIFDARQALIKSSYPRPANFWNGE